MNKKVKKAVKELYKIICEYLDKDRKEVFEKSCFYKTKKKRKK